jgi:Protein of unknown function (DUF2971)
VKFEELPNGDLSIRPDSARDFYEFLGVPVPAKRKYLFKYSRVTPYLLDSLRQNYPWMSRPTDFNDPFDCKVLIDYRLSSSEIAHHIRADIVRPAGRVYPLSGKGQYRFASRFAVDARDFDPNDPRSQNRMMNIAKLAERSEFLDDTLGVCCFTEDPLSILMWAHYAGNHSGVCLRFRHRSSSDLSEYCLPVQYRRTLWEARSRPDDSIGQARALIRSVLLKSSVWEYEREWRLVAFESGASSFNSRDLDAIILGVRISNRDRRAVLAVLRRKVFQHVKVLQAYQHPLRYSLRIV